MVQEKRRVTIVDIARKLGISAKSVSFGLNDCGRLSDKLRIRIKEVANEMGYRPNLAARRLVTHGSYLVGALLPYAQASFIGKLLDGIQSSTQREGIGLLLGNGGGTHEEIERSIRQMFSYGVSGLVVMPTHFCWEVYARDLHIDGLPVVQMMNPRMEIGNNYVEVNNVKASAEATGHLLALGHRNIGFVGINADDHSVRQRTTGYKMAMENYGIQVKPEWMEDVNFGMGKEELRTRISNLLDRAPELTSLFCVTDHIAVNVLHVLLQRGVKIPEEFSLIGFDGMDIASEQAIYPITTMVQPQEQIGRLAGNMLLEMIAGHNGGGISLNCDLQPGATTAPPPK